MSDQAADLSAALAGRYTVERELGRGGTATVYLARDEKHHRPVAIKVLNPELAAVVGTERFLNEINVTAHLRHPHILPLHDSGEADSFLYYVMPFAAGESLRERLKREKQLPVQEAVGIATAVASALGYAHRHGVIHRDIKPENILLEDGQPLVSDFGIALALSVAGGSRLTETGLSLGTPHYMSPEQMTGDRELDGRTDVYSLACVLYEMLAGEPPYTGSTAQAVIAKVLTESPRPVTELRERVPAPIARALDVALARLPADRFSTAERFAAALGAPAASAAPAVRIEATRDKTPEAVPVPGRRSRAVAVIIGAVALAGAFAGYALGVRHQGPGAVYDVGLPDSVPIALAKGGAWGAGWRALAVSQDGSFMVYIADRGTHTELWQRSLVDRSVHPIAGTVGVSQFALSPGGRSVALLAGSEARVVWLTDQSVQSIGTFARVAGVRWVSDRRVLITALEGRRLVSVDVQSGARDTISTGSDCFTPQPVGPPGTFLCAGVGTSTVGVVSADAVVDVETPSGSLYGSNPRWIDGRYLMWISRQGDLMAASWSGPGSRTGPPVRALHDIRSESVSGAGQYQISANGQLSYIPGENASIGRLVAVGSHGVVDTLRVPRGVIKQFDFPGDGKRLAVTTSAADGDELWVFDIATGKGQRWLTALEINEPRWSPAGDRLAAILRSAAEGKSVTIVGNPDANSPPDTLRPVSFTPSQWPRDDLIIGTVQTEQSNQDVVLVRLAGTEVTADTVRAVGQQSRAVLSPDGRRLAFMSDDDVVMEDYPNRVHHYRVGRGLDPLWIANDELVFHDGITWHWMRVNPASGRPMGDIRPTWTDPRFIDTPQRSQAVLPDGRLVYVQGSGRSHAYYVRVVPGWLSQLRKMVRAADAAAPSDGRR